MFTWYEEMIYSETRYFDMILQTQKKKHCINSKIYEIRHLIVVTKEGKLENSTINSKKFSG